ncbi:MAG: hypothetical protein A4E66_01319 [Syntrophus sp. PtaB.Bin001]|nr:MAG: hypothetical protein A4E66_01319 [Syntrophus sp. PtaB.Bin001]
MIGILHFRLGQCRLAGCTPVNRFFTFIDPPIQIKLAELFNGSRFVIIAHSQIRIRPIPENSEAHKLLPLDAHIFIGISPTETPLFNL